MRWKILGGLIVLFWAVMTGFVIRDAYFPEHSRFAAVPVRFVLELFLSEAPAFNNTLHLYHGPEKHGHMTFAIRRVETQDAPLYSLATNGAVDIPLTNAAESASIHFRGAGSFDELGTWKDLEIHFNQSEANLEGQLAWKTSKELPEISLTRDGQTILNSSMLKSLMDVASPALLPPILKDVLGPISILPRDSQPSAPKMTLSAREGLLELAGKKRKAYILTAVFSPQIQARVFFTELGELARIELPAHWRLLEPMLHGLERLPAAK